MKRSRIRPMLGAGVIFAIALMMFSQSSVPVGTAQSTGGFGGGIYDIVPDSPTGISSAVTGSPFFLRGTIVSHSPFPGCQPAGAAMGTWRAWGVIGDGGRVVMNHSLTFEPLNGSLELQGTTGVTLATDPASPNLSAPDMVNGPTEVLSLVGGAGTFRGANGEAQIRPYCTSNPLAPFRYDKPFCLVYKEKKRRPVDD